RAPDQASNELLDANGSNGDSSAEAREGRARPPGGKALLRKLQLLGSSGYDEAAADAISRAVAGDQVEELRARAEGVVPLPGQVRANGRRARKATAARPSVSSEEVAVAMQEAAAVLGPPDPSLPQWRSLGP